MGRHSQKKKKQGPKCIARTVPTLTSNVSNKKRCNQWNENLNMREGPKTVFRELWRVHAYKLQTIQALKRSPIRFPTIQAKRGVCEWVRERLDEFLNSNIECSQQPKLTKFNSIQSRSDRFFVTVSEQVLAITSHFVFLPSL